MPVNPEISLGIKPPAPAAGVGIGDLGGLAQTLNLLNQNKLFQQTYAAHQLAGQILATTDPSDPEAGIKALLQNPTVAGYGGEIIPSLRAAEQAQVAIQGQQQEQAQAGLAGFMKGLPAVLADPRQWQGIVDANMATLSPAAKARVGPAIESLRSALTDGLPTDLAAARAGFNQRLTGMLYAGMGPAAKDVLTGIFGTPSTIDVGGGIVPGLTLPPQLGGGFAPAQTPIGKTLAPTLPTLPGGVPGMPVGGAYGTSPGAAVNPPSAPGPPAATTVSSPYTPAPSGSPLYDPKRDGTSPSLGTAIGGLNVQSPAQVQANSDLQKEFSGNGLREFNNQNNSLSYLEYMDNAYDTLAKGGGFQVPGTAAGFRSDFAKTVNTLYQMTGKAPPFDPTKVGTAEEFNKQTNILGTQVLTTMLGNQREAAQTINKFTSAVPGINNTYLGGKLLIDTYKAAMQRGIDQRNFENAWQADPTNQGNLIGAAEAFNKQYPADGYAKQVLASHGLNQDGTWTSPAALKQAVDLGYLTAGQAKSLAVKQFGASPPGSP